MTYLNFSPDVQEKYPRYAKYPKTTNKKLKINNRKAKNLPQRSPKRPYWAKYVKLVLTIINISKMLKKY